MKARLYCSYGPVDPPPPPPSVQLQDHCGLRPNSLRLICRCIWACMGLGSKRPLPRRVWNAGKRCFCTLNQCGGREGGVCANIWMADFLLRGHTHTLARHMAALFSSCSAVMSITLSRATSPRHYMDYYRSYMYI
jgi:hypothetical protein